MCACERVYVCVRSFRDLGYTEVKASLARRQNVWSLGGWDVWECLACFSSLRREVSHLCSILY